MLSIWLSIDTFSLLPGNIIEPFSNVSHGFRSQSRHFKSVSEMIQIPACLLLIPHCSLCELFTVETSRGSVLVVFHFFIILFLIIYFFRGSITISEILKKKPSDSLVTAKCSLEFHSQRFHLERRDSRWAIISSLKRVLRKTFFEIFSNN